MKNEISRALEDPYDLESNAPSLLEYLTKTEIYIQSPAYADRKKEYSRNFISLKKKFNGDYQIPYPVSIPLAQEPVEFNDSLTELLFKRVSTREFVKREMSFEVLSFLLLMSAGLKDRSNPQSQRMFPSGGGLYTSRVYVDARNVTGLKSGIYLFNPYRETLDLVNDDVDSQKRYQLQRKAESLEAIENSCAQIFISIKPQLAAKKYGDLALRLELIEMGHLTQNLILVATGLGLSGFPSCTIHAGEAQNIFRTDSAGEFLLYSYIIGFSGNN